jgi:hypothetical protein
MTARFAELRSRCLEAYAVQVQVDNDNELFANDLKNICLDMGYGMNYAVRVDDHESCVSVVEDGNYHDIWLDSYNLNKYQDEKRVREHLLGSPLFTISIDEK